jgi:hypothetical protein
MDDMGLIVNVGAQTPAFENLGQQLSPGPVAAVARALQA